MSNCTSFQYQQVFQAILPYLLNISLESCHIVITVKERLPFVVYGVDKNSQWEHITWQVTRSGQYVLWCSVIQIRLSPWPKMSLPLTSIVSGLTSKTERLNVTSPHSAQYICDNSIHENLFFNQMMHSYWSFLSSYYLSA